MNTAYAGSAVPRPAFCYPRFLPIFNHGEPAVYYCFAWLYVSSAGPGPWSLDAAVRRLEAESPAAVLLHLRIDSTQVQEAVMAIRNVSPAVALILYSGHVPSLDRSEVEVPREWVYARLQKPFAVERLTALLDELLAGS